MTTKAERDWVAMIRTLRVDDQDKVLELCEAMIAREHGEPLTERQAAHLAHVDAGDWATWACPVSADV